ncbi:hypothetical protein [Streptomyces sp. NPDC101234]|uniref:hypothetical protein n=1 Tax=Streptomyces sp. NPDC101234 TaxID=3366138 RepID=UPI0038260FBB
MAVSLVAFAVIQIVMPTVVRPHLVKPVSPSVQLTKSALSTLNFLGEYGTVGGLKVPDGAWAVSTSPMLDSAGKDIGHTKMYADCIGIDNQSATLGCLAEQNLHVKVTEQPATRYRDVQWYESGVHALVTAGLAGLGLWRVRGRLN